MLKLLNGIDFEIIGLIVLTAGVIVSVFSFLNSLGLV